MEGVEGGMDFGNGWREVECAKWRAPRLLPPLGGGWGSHPRI